MDMISRMHRLAFLNGDCFVLPAIFLPFICRTSVYENSYDRDLCKLFLGNLLCVGSIVGGAAIKKAVTPNS